VHFVDCHSHVLPSGDDGARSVVEALALSREAAEAGTAILFATPHVWPSLPLSPRREAEIGRALAEVAARAPLELRLGYELTPAPELLEEDPRRFVLQGTDRVLMEVPFVGSADELWSLGEHVEAAGLMPVIAHPERAEAVQLDPSIAFALAERGWVVQVNATSLLGFHGETEERLGWELLEQGVATLVASDGHGPPHRPPRLDAAYALARNRLGASALGLFDGSALGLSTTPALA